MGPPSLFVGLGKGQAARQPEKKVVVQGAALLQLCDPDVSQAVAAPAHPDADALEQFTDVLGVPLPDLSIGQGQHGGLVALVPQLELMHSRRGEHRALHSTHPRQDGVDLNQTGIEVRSTCMRSDKPRAACGVRCACPVSYTHLRAHETM
jgi:hypothetical protein